MDNKTINIHMQVTGPFPAQMAANGAAVQGFGAQSNAGMAKATTGMARFGQVASKVGTVSVLAVAAGLALSAKAAIDFESSFAGVRKTVETSEAGFTRLASGVREMAMEIPIGVNELNRIMELGGQLGVDPGGLLDFTDTIAKIGVTTTLSTEAASMGFARLDNIMQLGGKSFDRMGSAIVDLGNNFAATEDEIMTFALRIAPVGATVGASIEDVLAIATAFTSVGVPAERGGTAIQKTFIKMAEAVKMGGKELDIFSRTAGMTAGAFQELFESDPALAFEAFVSGLDDVERSGGNVFATLDAVDLSNQRVIASLLAMANADGVLLEALGMSNEAFMENNALNEEAAKRFGTTESQMKLLKGRLNDMAIAIGTNLLPEIINFLDGIDMILDAISKIPGVVDNAILAIGGIGAAVALATGHPVIAGLALVAAGIWAIGREAAEAEQRIIDMKYAAGSDEGYNSAAGLSLLEQTLGEGGVKELAEWGYGLEEIDRIVKGTDDDWADFFTDIKEEAGGLTGDMPQAVLALQRFREEHEGIVRVMGDESEAMLRAARATLTNQSAREQMFADQVNYAGEKGGGDRYFPRGLPQIPVEAELDLIIPAVLDSKTEGKIRDALGTYGDIFTDAFVEIDDALRDSIDLWYEWGDAIEINVDDLIDSVARQVTAVGGFERAMRELDLSAGAEEFIRDNFGGDAMHMEAFLTLMREAPGEFARFIRELEGEIGTGASRLSSIVAEKWEEHKPALEFTAGAELLAELAAIADEIEKDPENTYNTMEIWKALIQTTIDEAGPELAPQIIGMLETVFGAGGIPGVDMTIAELEMLLALLNGLPTDIDIDVGVTTHIDTFLANDALHGGASDPDPTIGITGYEPKAFGGPVKRGYPYMVGERGSELFVPFTNGTIIPNNMIGGGGNSINLSFVVDSASVIPDIQTALVVSGVADLVDLRKAGL